MRHCRSAWSDLTRSHFKEDHGDKESDKLVSRGRVAGEHFDLQSASCNSMRQAESSTHHSVNADNQQRDRVGV